MGPMKARVYLETSIVSYLTARPSRDVLAVAHQQISTEWWDRRRRDFDVVISVLVLNEARRGDPDAAQRRLELLQGIPRVEVTEPAKELATNVVKEGLLPETAYPDALHIATATVHEVDYLLTWNCSHIANAEILPKVAAICERSGLALPYVCTPEELLGEAQ